MPVVTLQVPEGVYTAEMKKEIVAKITDAVIEVEGVPQLRPHVTVLVTEVADGGWGAGGRALTLEQMKQQFTPSTQDPQPAPASRAERL
jgi:4-oxalocrotonate tautomerase